MKLTLELPEHGLIASVEDPKVGDLGEALGLVEQLLRAAGYSFDGYIDIINPDDFEDDDESDEKTYLDPPDFKGENN